MALIISFKICSLELRFLSITVENCIAIRLKIMFKASNFSKILCSLLLVKLAFIASLIASTKFVFSKSESLNFQ